MHELVKLKGQVTYTDSFTNYCKRLRICDRQMWHTRHVSASTASHFCCVTCKLHTADKYDVMSSCLRTT
eukprot:16042-Heterococcus_DN1.PRE.4